MASIEEKVEALVAPVVSFEGYGIVRVKWMGSTRKTLQIMIERLDQEPVTVEDCERTSYLVSALLDVHDVISERHHLEISSPGIDRPLIKHADFERFVGEKAKCKLLKPIEGRKRFKGVIVKVGEQDLVLKLHEDQAEVTIPFSLITDASLDREEDIFNAANQA